MPPSPTHAPDPCHRDTAPRTLVMGIASTAHEAWMRVCASEADATPVGVLPARERDLAAADALALPLLGGPADLERVLTETGASVVLLAIPGAMHALINELTIRIEQAGASARWLPPMSDTIAGRTGSAPGALDLAKLIGREPRPIDAGLVRSVVAGKRVLITGAGGSIGSEIARIVCAHAPSEIILMERSENALFEIDRELASTHPAVARRAVLHDVVEDARTNALMRQLSPHIVFHAAAHKHVPMMEDHPSAAVTNNVFGTKAVFDGAINAGAERFVLVSTDKAVHPTSVMGATKRLAELYVRSRAREVGTRCAVVRFGNVLGSACSVLPIWDGQIAQGGPLTITDERMTRYFMTIPEAASLVIQSAAIPQGEDAGVYVLDMGDAIRIADLAERLLAQRGVGPQSDAVELRFTGIRPGEKLYEELAYATETLAPTSVPGVRAWSGASPSMSRMARMIEDLGAVRSSSEPGDVIRVLRDCVPEMTSGSTPETPKAVILTTDIPNTSRTQTTHAA